MRLNKLKLFGLSFLDPTGSIPFRRRAGLRPAPPDERVVSGAPSPADSPTDLWGRRTRHFVELLGGAPRIDHLLGYEQSGLSGAVASQRAIQAHPPLPRLVVRAEHEAAPAAQHPSAERLSRRGRGEPVARAVESARRASEEIAVAVTGRLDVGNPS